MKEEIPFYSLDYQHAQIKSALERSWHEVMDSGKFILGDKVRLFEQQYADYIGVKHCIGVGNGLDAMTISLKALGIGPGDEVIVSAHTFIATVLSIRAAGAIPVLVDINPATFNIDVNAMEDKISARTKAIIAVHLYGLACDMDQILAIASAHQLFVLEDNAQAAGTVYKGRKTGSFGHLNAHSFYPTKNLGALGDGGAITTNDDELARKVRLLGNYGSEVKYKHDSSGCNSRLDELQAAALSVKLKFLDQWIEEKRRLANVYHDKLKNTANVICPLIPTEKGQHSYHLYVVRSKERNALADYLRADQIHTLIHYPIPLYRQQALSNVFEGQTYPITEQFCNEVLSLPLFPGMTYEQVERVVIRIRSFAF